MEPGDILLRALEKGDAPALVALAHRQGRNVHATEYERFLRLEGARGFVLTRDGALLGVATAMRYFDRAFLGPVLLQEGADSVGLAIALLSQVIEVVRREGVAAIEAEATPEEEAILGRMGFERVRGTLILERDADRAAPAGGTMPMAIHHLLDVGALDAAAVGWGRKEYLASLQDETPAGARVVEHDGEVAGYALMRRSRRGYHLGPLVTRAGDADAARRLLADALGAADGWPVVALVPEGGALLPALEAQGFRRVGALVRMRARLDASAAGAGEVEEWAIGGRITG